MDEIFQDDSSSSAVANLQKGVGQARNFVDKSDIFSNSEPYLIFSS